MNTRVEKHPLAAFGRLGFVVAMHVALLVVLARSFNLVPPKLFEGSQVVDVEQPAPPDETLPPVDPDVRYEQHVTLVPQEVQITEESDPEQTITQPPRDETGGGRTGSAVVTPEVINVRADPRHPLTQPAYPPLHQRNGDEGSVDIEIYVLASGRIGDARVVRSSGFERMDQSALDEAKRRWRMLPATRDGEPFAQWHRLRVTFQIRN